MIGKGLALIVLVLMSIVAMGLRMAGQSRAAASNCYSDGPGPSTPTIC